MGKEKTIHSFFKRKESDEEGSSKRHKTSTSEAETHETQQVNLGNVEGPLPQANTNEVDTKEEDSSNFERDPGKRKQLWEYPPNLREQVRRFYLGEGPYQILLNEYPKDDSKKNPRKFQPSWFRVFPNWLDHGHDSFIVKGFKNWKKVRGKDCAFLKHISTTQHRSALIFKENLLNQAAHIENVISKQNEELIMKNRLRLKTTIDVIRWLTFQACALRGHDESSTSKNRGNFLEMLQLLASYNDEVANVILGNAPYNSKYTSSDIQKEILNIIANRVRKSIRSEVGDSYYCVMVDESRDESKKEQMAIVLRFVDEKGIIRERFLGLVHVRDTLSATLKLSLWQQLSHNQFDVNKIRGQGYDGASNMRGEWNGLQALVLKDSPYAYYIHCFAHRLQLALVCASKEVLPVHKFFSDLVGIINVVCASSKRHDELQKAKQDEIKELLELGEIKSGKGKNQVGTLKRPGDTRWGSHFDSICSLLKMYNVTLTILKRIMDDPSSKYTQRGDAYDSVRFSEHTMELLSLSASLASKEINVEDICLLVERYYPGDFTEQERIGLQYQLENLNIEMKNNIRLSGVSNLPDLCKTLVETQKRETYNLVDRVCRLILTLPVSTATTERAFSAMKIFKTRLRNKMSDEYLADSLVIYLEKEIAENFDSNSIIDEFKDLKGRRAEL
ncbi:hypothetical protein SSX86_024926 [Deinandra increscens subsp. villosa]|uniref:TTF-type domain-containing protein n=1 Tax=Deinandra increscens subsp. villosa TaxID=3103831 RepID=A0AAP0GLK5_9ASTR